MLKATINGKEQILAKGLTLLEFIEQKKLNKDALVIELNNTIVKKEDFAKTNIQQGDVIEIISFVGGG